MRIGVVQVRDAQPLIWSLPERATLSIAVHDCCHDFLTTSCDCDIEFSSLRPCEAQPNPHAIAGLFQASSKRLLETGSAPPPRRELRYRP